MTTHDDRELLTAAEAAAYLGVDKRRMAALLKESLPFTRHPLDNRIKLIKRADVDALKARYGALPRAKNAA